VRTTTRPVVLGGFELPPECEIVLCPFVSHRDPEYFPRPDDFTPDRWQRTAPSPFVFFPFGAGAHACVGRTLALLVIRAALTCLIPRFDLVLDGDQAVDWRLHIIFMPREDPLVAIRSATDRSRVRSGTLGGPVAAMLRLDI
jgi:cytochrome P450